MLIKEACETCHMTKKAVEYYENKGLIKPLILENGYRNYDEKDICTLKEISVLRKCGISIKDIKGILACENKKAAIKKMKYINEIRIEKLNAINNCMNNLISKYNIDEEFEKLQNNENDLFTIKEQIAYAFPGSYGIFISLHFGRFLNGTIDTKEKKDAFDAIVSYLNNLDMHISEKLSEYMEEIFKDEIDIAKLSEVQHNGILEILNNTDEYLEQNQKFFEEYIDFRTSDEFKNIPSFDFLNAMLDFQKNSGYKEVFIENMKKLSPEYAEYIVKLEEANRIFIEKFPKANNLDFI